MGRNLCGLRTGQVRTRTRTLELYQLRGWHVPARSGPARLCKLCKVRRRHVPRWMWRGHWRLMPRVRDGPVQDGTRQHVGCKMQQLHKGSLPGRAWRVVLQGVPGVRRRQVPRWVRWNERWRMRQLRCRPLQGRNGRARVGCSVLAVRQGPVRGCRWRDSMHNMRDRKVPDCNGPERMRGLRSMPRGSGAN